MLALVWATSGPLSPLDTTTPHLRGTASEQRAGQPSRVCRDGEQSSHHRARIGKAAGEIRHGVCGTTHPRFCPTGVGTLTIHIEDQ